MENYRSTELSLTSLAPELLHQIYNSLSTIGDVINLSLSCKHFHTLLRASQKLPTLFLAAEREFGPIDSIAQLVTYNSSQPAHIKRQPQQSYALLRQMIKIGNVAKKVEEIYPSRRWQENYLERRSLSVDESWRVRQAVYRFWLYCEAFHNRNYTRVRRSLPAVVEERAQLLRTWTTEELTDIEDLRIILEDLLATEICPTDGAARRSFNDNCDFSDARYSHHNNPHAFYNHQAWNSWPPDRYSSSHLLPSSLFHNFRDDQLLPERDRTRSDLPVPQRRKLEMTGWGDDITQYYIIQSMLKLNPAQIVWLFENATRKKDVEAYIADSCGPSEEWFWDNGETWLDTWSLILHRRGLTPGQVRDQIRDGACSITSGGSMHDPDSEASSNILRKVQPYATRKLKIGGEDAEVEIDLFERWFWGDWTWHEASNPGGASADGH